MPTKNAVLKELELYMGFMSDGATGQLLKDCYKLIIKQDVELKLLIDRLQDNELKRPKKKVKSKKKI